MQAKILYKVSKPISITYLNRTRIFKWYVVRCGSNNEHHKHMCSKENGLHAQIFAYHSRLNNQHNWRTNEFLIRKRIFTL